MVYYLALGTGATELDNAERSSGMSFLTLGPIEIGVILVIALIIFGILLGIVRGTWDRRDRT
jgi:hypothetical protein